MPLGHTCNRRDSVGAIPIFRFVGNEAAPSSGAGGCWPKRLDPVSDNQQPLRRRESHSTDGSGSLRVVSYARPSKLFTASESLVVAQVAVLKAATFKQIVNAVVDLLRAGISA
jgi:hypothetical protein